MRARIDLEALWRRAGRDASAALRAQGQAVAPELLGPCPLPLDEVLDPEFDYQHIVALAKGRALAAA